MDNLTAPPASGVRLYQSAASSASWRVRIALAIKSVAYEPVLLDLYSDDHLSPQYGDIVATKQVPCLEIDGHRLFQSVAIIEYLDETRPTPPLMPATSSGRAHVRAVTELINSGIQPMHNLAVRRHLGAQFDATNDDVNAWCRHWIELRFHALDRLAREAGGRYACGDTLTMADVFLYPQVKTSDRFGVHLDAFPALCAVMQNLDELPPFRDSVPGRS